MLVFGKHFNRPSSKKIYINKFEKNLQISNLIKIRPVGQADGETEGCDVTNSRFSKLCESAKQNEEEILKS
jgi:hypothetical protein